MFAFFKGVVAEKTPLNCVIESSGVGYNINITLKTFQKLANIGEEDTLFIHTAFSENDGFRLFGFHSKEEKQMFEKLITASKIGPKIAISVLSKFSAQQLTCAIYNKDVTLLCTIPGIGKKSAERLIVELIDKLPTVETTDKSSFEPKGNIGVQVEQALIALGYRANDVLKAVRAIPDGEYENPEQMIKHLIKKLYKP